MGHPDVLEAAVIGLPHERWQERPLACVVPKPGQQPTKESILAHLKDRVAKWWLPGDVVFVDALPKTSVGKVAKRELRERLKDHLYLSYPIDIYDRSSGMVLGKPSRFVEGLPGDVLNGLQVIEEIYRD